MRALTKHVLVLAALIVLASSTAQAAIDLATVQKLLADDGMTWGTAVIGAALDDDKGSAYVFAYPALRQQWGCAVFSAEDLLGSG